MPSTKFGSDLFTSGEKDFVEAHKRLNCDPDANQWPTNQLWINIMGYAICGFFGLLVHPLEERAKCFLCRQSFPLKSEKMNELRVFDAGQAIAC